MRARSSRGGRPLLRSRAPAFRPPPLRAGKKIAILGFAFKKDTGDTRETPAIHVCEQMMKEGAALAIYDPKVTVEQMNYDLGSPAPEKVCMEDDAYIACAGAHAIAVLTEWDEFKTLDYTRIYASMVKPCFVFDGRNILDHAKLREIGFQVFAIGKAFSNDASVED